MGRLNAVRERIVERKQDREKQLMLNVILESSGNLLFYKLIRISTFAKEI